MGGLERRDRAGRLVAAVAPDAVAERLAGADGPLLRVAELHDAVRPFREPVAVFQIGRVVLAAVAALVGRKQLEIDEPHVHVGFREAEAVTHSTLLLPNSALVSEVMTSSS